METALWQMVMVFAAIAVQQATVTSSIKRRKLFEEQ